MYLSIREAVVACAPDALYHLAALPHVGESWADPTRSFRVNVSDGKLTLTLDDLGGGDPNAVINVLEVAADGGRKLDFGTGSSPVQAGYTRVAENLAYNANRGYGWLSGTRASRDRGGANALNRDFNFTTLATFVAALSILACALASASAARLPTCSSIRRTSFLYGVQNASRMLIGFETILVTVASQSLPLRS